MEVRSLDLISFNFENERSTLQLEIGRVTDIFNATYKFGKQLVKPAKQNISNNFFVLPMFLITL